MKILYLKRCIPCPVEKLPPCKKMDYIVWAKGVNTFVPDYLEVIKPLERQLGRKSGTWNYPGFTKLTEELYNLDLFELPDYFNLRTSDDIMSEVLASYKLAVYNPAMFGHTIERWFAYVGSYILRDASVESLAAFERRVRALECPERLLSTDRSVEMAPLIRQLAREVWEYDYVSSNLIVTALRDNLGLTETTLPA